MSQLPDSSDAQYAPTHGHEPEIPPAFDAEGRCLVCVVLVDLNRTRLRADNAEQEAVKLRAQVRVLCDALDGVQAAVSPAAEVAAIYREVNR